MMYCTQRVDARPKAEMKLHKQGHVAVLNKMQTTHRGSESPKNPPRTQWGNTPPQQLLPKARFKQQSMECFNEAAEMEKQSPELPCAYTNIVGMKGRNGGRINGYLHRENDKKPTGSEQQRTARGKKIQNAMWHAIVDTHNRTSEPHIASRQNVCRNTTVQHGGGIMQEEGGIRRCRRSRQRERNSGCGNGSRVRPQSTSESGTATYKAKKWDLDLRFGTQVDSNAHRRTTYAPRRGQCDTKRCPVAHALRWPCLRSWAHDKQRQGEHVTQHTV